MNNKAFTFSKNEIIMSRNRKGRNFMKIKIGKNMILALFVLLVVSVLGACSSSSGGEKEKSDDSETVIRFATWDVADDIELQQGLVDDFNESQDEIKVVLEAYGSEYDTKIAAGMGAKDAPDVMYMWNYPQYKDGLEPLDSYIEDKGAEYKDNFYETLWNYNALDEEIYGIPVGYTTHVVYYNKDIFEEAGIDYPQSNWTWEDLQETAKALTNESTKTTGFVFPGKPDPYDFEMFLWGNGTAFADEEGNLEGSINSPKGIEVFELFQGMLKEGYAITSEGSGDTEMRSGRVGMFINGAWYLSSLQNAGINIGIVEIPAFANGTSASVVSSSGLSISKDSKHKEEAFKFIEFWTGEEANKARMDFELPVLKAVVEEEGLEEDPLLKPFYIMLEKSEAYIPSSFIVDNWSRVSEDLSLAFEEIFNPSTMYDPEKALSIIVP